MGLNWNMVLMHSFYVLKRVRSYPDEVHADYLRAVLG